MSRWTSATSSETEAEPVPIGMRQKSAVTWSGVGRDVRSAWDMVVATVSRNRVWKAL